MVHLTDPGPAPRPTLGRQLEDHFQGVLGPKDMASCGNMGANNVHNSTTSYVTTVEQDRVQISKFGVDQALGQLKRDSGSLPFKLFWRNRNERLDSFS